MSEKQEVFTRDPVKKRSPLKAIRAFCLECMCSQREEIKKCTAPGCPLYEFRLGKNPYLAQTLTEEKRQNLRDRMIAYNKAKANDPD